MTGAPESGLFSIRNHDRSAGIWLVFYKKHTGKPAIEYDAAVEEALCFGWIDSIIRKLDEERYARKITPRKADSRWSALNKKRAEKMIEQGLMTAPGRARINEAKRSGLWDRSARSAVSLDMPEEFEHELRHNTEAGKVFRQLAPSYQRQCTGWIAAAKRRETREKRIQEAIALLKRAKNSV